MVAWIQPEESCPPGGPRRDQAIPLQRLKRLLDRGEADLEESRELARVTLREEVQREQHPGARGTAERAGRGYDLHKESYDLIMRSYAKDQFP